MNANIITLVGTKNKDTVYIIVIQLLNLLTCKDNIDIDRVYAHNGLPNDI